MDAPWNIEIVELQVSKHFALNYMREWGWDFHDLRDALRDAYKIDKMGKEKYEIYLQKKGFKKIITIYYQSENVLFCITGSEGGKRK